MVPHKGLQAETDSSSHFPNIPEFLNLPGVSRSMLRRGRVLDRSGARNNRAGARDRRLWALSSMSRGQGKWGGSPVVCLNQECPGNLTLASETGLFCPPAPPSFSNPPPYCWNTRTLDQETGFPSRQRSGLEVTVTHPRCGVSGGVLEGGTGSAERPPPQQADPCLPKATDAAWGTKPFLSPLSRGRKQN